MAQVPMQFVRMKPVEESARAHCSGDPVTESQHERWCYAREFRRGGGPPARRIPHSDPDDALARGCGDLHAAARDVVTGHRGAKVPLQGPPPVPLVWPEVAHHRVGLERNR